MSKNAAILLIPSLFIFSQVNAAEPQSESDRDWKHSIEIYAQALNIHGNSKVKNLDANVDVDPEFIMDHIDMGAMLRWESIHSGRWGFYLDYSFMKLSGKTDSLLQANLNRISADIELRQGVLEAKGFKRYKYDFGSIDYMAGFRWWDNDVETEIRSVNGFINKGNSPDEDWVDYLVGARLITPLTTQWSLYISGDIGIGSDTDFTSALHTGARYQINSWSDINLSYKSTWVDYDNEDTFAYDTATHGFLVGWAAQF